MTINEENLKNLHSGTTEDQIECAKENKLNLSADQASAALTKLTNIATAAKLVDVSGGGDEQFNRN